MKYLVLSPLRKVKYRVIPNGRELRNAKLYLGKYLIINSLRTLRPLRENIKIHFVADSILQLSQDEILNRFAGEA